MRIHMTARHCEMDPEDRLFTEQRLEKLSRFVHDIHEAHIVLTAEKYRHSAEITLHLRGRDVVSREEATGARIALERAADRIEHQLRRIKEKRVERQRGSRAKANGLAPPQEPVEEGEERGEAAGEE